MAASSQVSEPASAAKPAEQHRPGETSYSMVVNDAVSIQANTLSDRGPGENEKYDGQAITYPSGPHLVLILSAAALVSKLMGRALGLA